MARLVSTNEKKSTPTTELIRLKKELQRVTEQLASRDCELAEAAASGTNLQSVMDAIVQNAAELCDAVEHRGVAGRRQGQAHPCALGSIMRQVQEEDDEIDRAFIVAAPMIGREEEVAPKKSPPRRSMWRLT